MSNETWAVAFFVTLGAFVIGGPPILHRVAARHGWTAEWFRRHARTVHAVYAVATLVMAVVSASAPPSETKWVMTALWAAAAVLAAVQWYLNPWAAARRDHPAGRRAGPRALG